MNRSPWVERYIQGMVWACWHPLRVDPRPEGTPPRRTPGGRKRPHPVHDPLPPPFGGLHGRSMRRRLKKVEARGILQPATKNPGTLRYVQVSPAA